MPGVVASAAVGAIPYFVVDSACGTALLLALGSEVAPAVRHQWSLNGMALPYACVGAIAGLLATDVGWWAAVAVLAPLPWVPEVLLVRARWLRRAPIRARVSVLAGGVAVGATVVAVTRVGAAGDYAPFVLVALAALLGLELRVSARRAVAPLTALVVVPAALLDGPGAVAVAAAVAAVTAAASWAAAHRTALAPAAVAVLSAALGGAVAGALVWMAFPGTDSTGLVAEGAAAAAAFVAVATVASRDHRGTALSAWWCSPILAVGVLAGGWQGHGATAPLFAVITTAGALVATAWCAAPPWPSTLLGPGLDRRGPRRRRRAAVVVATFAFATALLEGVASSRSARLTAVTVAAVLGEVVIGMTIAAVRQWRFAPRARVLDGAILGASALVLLFVYVPLASAGLEIGLPLMCGVLVTALARSWRPLGHADRVPARRDSNNIRATSSADVDAALSRRSLS